MKRWNILYNKKANLELKAEKIVDILLANRGVVGDGKKAFFGLKVGDISSSTVGIEKKELEKFLKRIGEALDKKERIVIFGDYDVDGICASAILWETMYSKTKNAVPYIPDRIEEGYGLSVKGIDNVLEKYPDTKLIITVDNGIVAHDAVAFANTKGIDVIVTDHHVKGEKLPDAFCILHTTSLCGAGIAWMLAEALRFEDEGRLKEKLTLAAIATVADLVPLVGANRVIVREGIELIKKSKRPGLVELIKASGIDQGKIDVYTIGHVIAPRMNAAGRIQSAMNPLRLLCTNNVTKATTLATLLSQVNRDRQGLTGEMVEHAKLLAIESSNSKVTVVAHESYNQGVIGLVASQLVESYYRPSIAIAIGEDISKGSARSIVGVNIVELLRSVSDTLLEVGGHPMAAGFSVETKRIGEFTQEITKKAEVMVADSLLERFLDIDMELSFLDITKKLFDEISQLQPFGMANPEPTFVTRGVEALEVRKIGRDQTHLKMKLEQNGKIFDAIGFRLADKIDVSTGDDIDIAYIIDENVWNGKTSLQLKIRDLHSR